jgi:hypothetical protein
MEYMDEIPLLLREKRLCCLFHLLLILSASDYYPFDYGKPALFDANILEPLSILPRLNPAHLLAIHGQ